MFRSGFMAIVAGLTALAAGAGGASAQSYPGGRPGIWSGFYVGLNAGGGWSTAGRYEGEGFVGGGHVGYNWQSANLVFGLEADFDGSSIEAKRSTDLGGGIIGTAKHSHDWLASIRGRVGITLGDVLLYGTGGIAFTSTEFDASVTNGVATAGVANATTTATGWVLGGGGEMKFGPNWSGRIEGLHYSFDEKFDFGFMSMRNKDVGVTVVRGGLSLHFN